MYFRGMQLPDLREGDQVYPGTPVADVLDLSELEVSAKVGEVDRANLREGQDATIQLDAMPQKRFHARIKSLSGTASANVWSGDVAKKFDVVFSVDMKELMSGLGARPEQIARVLETAERNRKKPVVPEAAEAPTPAGGSPGVPAPVGFLPAVQRKGPRESGAAFPARGRQPARCPASAGASHGYRDHRRENAERNSYSPRSGVRKGRKPDRLRAARQPL